MIVIQLSYYQALSNAKNVIAQCDATKFKDSNSLSGNGNGNAVSPHPFWRSIIGDICQLPSIPRPTNDPSKYIECVFQADNTGNRTHLGIWITKKCPSGYQFVAPARKCETIDFIENQQQLCDGPNREYYEFCLQPKINSRYMVKEVEQQMEQCICLDEEKKCECPKITTIELVPYSDKSNGSKVRFVRDVACPDHHVCDIPITHCRDCTTSSCICGISTAYTPAAISFPSFPTAYGFPQLPSQQTRAGCRFLDSGELYCPQLQKQVKIPLLDVTASQPCALVNGQSLQNARYQGICSWMIDPLIADPESPSHFLQCQPAPKSSYCGRWQRMPCEPDLIFNAQLQVCVWNHEENPGPIPAQIAYPQITPTYPTITKLPSYPLSLIPETDANAKCNCGIGVQIGSCNANGQCPGHSTCKANQMDGQIFVVSRNVEKRDAVAAIRERYDFRENCFPLPTGGCRCASITNSGSKTIKYYDSYEMCKIPAEGLSDQHRNIKMCSSKPLGGCRCILKDSIGEKVIKDFDDEEICEISQVIYEYFD